MLLTWSQLGARLRLEIPDSQWDAMKKIDAAWVAKKVHRDVARGRLYDEDRNTKLPVVCSIGRVLYGSGHAAFMEANYVEIANSYVTDSLKDAFKIFDTGFIAITTLNDCGASLGWYELKQVLPLMLLLSNDQGVDFANKVRERPEYSSLTATQIWNWYVECLKDSETIEEQI